MAPSSSDSCRKFNKNLLRFCNFRPIYLVLIYSIILLLCSAIIPAESAQNDRFPTKVSPNCNPDKNPNCDKSPLVNRTPRQNQPNKPSESLMAFINWLFGPPANANKPVAGYSASTENSTSNFDNSKPEPKIEQAVVTSSPMYPILSVSTERSTSGQRQKHKKNIEITDIQASIGTELYSSQLQGDPSQVNLKDELDLVEKFDQSVKQRPQAQLKSDLPGQKRTGRLKREPYKPIKVPYTTANKADDMSTNILRQRQLLVNPYEQQMMALQQQQAAAAMLQQQQMNTLLNGNRYAVLDDYDREDDDDTEEDSDEFDDFPRFGPPPMIEHHHMYLRNGLPPQIPVPPYQRKLGWGLKRRSVADKNKQQQRRKFENGDSERGRGRLGGGNRPGQRRGFYKNRASLTNGQWVLDDYDLNSEFHFNPKERKNVGNDHIERPELDEEEHYEQLNKKVGGEDEMESKARLRQRGDMEGIHKSRQEESDSSSSISIADEGNAASDEPTSESSASSDDATSESSAASDGSSTSENSAASDGSSTSESSAQADEATSESSAASDGSSTSESSASSDGSTTAGLNVSEGPSTEGDATSESSTTDGGSSTDGSSTLGLDTSDGPSTSAGNTTEELSSTTEGTSSNSTTDSTGSDSDSSTTEEMESETSSTTEEPKPPPPYTATLNCRCGTQSVSGGTVSNGTVVRYNVNPWLVAISNRSSHMCSGSIINDRYILTSKSCVRDASPNSLTVTAGQTSSNNRNFTVTKISTNPNANIALLQLKSGIKPSSSMRPVCLPIGKRYAGQYSSGTLVTFKRSTPTLQVVDTEVSILGNKNSKCKSNMKGTICAGPPGSTKCGGDSGGVLMVYRGGYSYEQIGVVSGTVGCRSSSSPGIYTDIRKRTRWILNNSKEGNYCKSPQVTDEDLMSSTRFGDPYFELNEDFEDTSELGKQDFEDDAAEKISGEDASNSAEILDSLLEELI